jgi:hypothetical protein
MLWKFASPTLRLAQMQGHRYWVERIFEDAKGECGLGDYQALGWQAWHHHVTMVMLNAQGDLAAQTRRQGGAGAPDQRTSPAAARRHPIPFPHRGKITAAIANNECDSVKLVRIHM